MVFEIRSVCAGENWGKTSNFRKIDISGVEVFAGENRVGLKLNCLVSVFRRFGQLITCVPGFSQIPSICEKKMNF